MVPVSLAEQFRIVLPLRRFLAAGIVSLPQESPHTSINEQVGHAKSKGRMCDVAEIRNGSMGAAKGSVCRYATSVV